jgi:hypothetical protein
MEKSSRQSADDLKSERLPLVDAHDEIELHGTVTFGSGMSGRMLVHLSSVERCRVRLLPSRSCSHSCRRACRHRADWAEDSRSQGSRHPPPRQMSSGLTPSSNQAQRTCSGPDRAHTSRRLDRRRDNGPNGVGVGRLRGSDQHPLLMPSQGRDRNRRPLSRLSLRPGAGRLETESSSRGATGRRNTCVLRSRNGFAAIRDGRGPGRTPGARDAHNGN